MKTRFNLTQGLDPIFRTNGGWGAVTAAGAAASVLDSDPSRNSLSAHHQVVHTLETTARTFAHAACDHAHYYGIMPVISIAPGEQVQPGSPKWKFWPHPYPPA